MYSYVPADDGGGKLNLIAVGRLQSPRVRELSVAVDRYPVGLLDGTQAGGYPGLADGDGLAVLPAVGT